MCISQAALLWFTSALTFSELILLIWGRGDRSLIMLAYQRQLLIAVVSPGLLWQVGWDCPPPQQQLTSVESCYLAPLFPSSWLKKCFLISTFHAKPWKLVTRLGYTGPTAWSFYWSSHCFFLQSTFLPPWSLTTDHSHKIKRSLWSKRLVTVHGS